MADWDKIGSEGQVEDRRGASSVAMGGASVLSLVVLVGYMLLGGNASSPTFQKVMSGLQDVAVSKQTNDSGQFAGKDNFEIFAGKVVGSNNDTWREVMKSNGLSYTEPKLVLFRQATRSGCGVATSEIGPHYCPEDMSLYLDETFFEELTMHFGAKGGDVAQAYVIAHEMAHHAQNQLGILSDVHEKMSQASEAESNALSVKLELQADCFAGVWSHAVSELGVIRGDEIAQALDAAASVGDDRIQKSAGQRVNRESWTHGSSDQRVSWFTKGYQSGSPKNCDTFAN